MLDPKTLCKQVWTMRRCDGSVISSAVRLMPSGRINGIDSDNEASWRVCDSGIELLTKSGIVSARLSLQPKRGYDQPDFSGPYLLAPELNWNHTLTSQLNVAAFNRRLAVLVRTHVVNPKLLDLLDDLGVGLDFDLYVAADETRECLDLPAVRKLSHSVDMCAQLGLSRSVPQGPLLWYMGDYALYCSYAQIPDYDYYLMVEYDVHFRGGGAAFCSHLMLVIESHVRRPDLVSIEVTERNADWDNYAQAARHFAKVYGAFFPFVLLSRRGVEFLLQERRRSTREQEEQLFCESFVPSKLADAGYRITDLNEMVPHSWNKDVFRWNHPFRLKSRNAPFANVLSHPVYDEEEFWTRKMHRAIHSGTSAAFAEEVLAEDDDSPAWQTLREQLLRVVRQHEAAQGQ